MFCTFFLAAWEGNFQVMKSASPYGSRGPWQQDMCSFDVRTVTLQVCFVRGFPLPFPEHTGIRLAQPPLLSVFSTVLPPDSELKNHVSDSKTLDIPYIVIKKK